MQKIHPKVRWAAVSGALTTLVVWVLGMFGVDVPAVVAAAIATVMSGGAGYATSSD